MLILAVVERIFKMVDGGFYCWLMPLKDQCPKPVCSAESFKFDLKPIVVINKVDRREARSRGDRRNTGSFH